VARERRYIPVEEKSYRVHFMIIALLMIGVTAWAVWDETFTRRPWKKYQVEGNRLEIAQAEGEKEKAIADLSRGGRQKKLDALRKELEAEEARLRDPQVKAKIEEAKKKLADLTIEKRKTAEQLTFRKSEADELNYWYWRAVLQHRKTQDPTEKASLAEEIKERKAELDAKDAEVAELGARADAAEKAEKDQRAAVDAFYAKQRKLKGDIDDLLGEVTKAEKKVERLKKFSSLFSPEINQVVVSELGSVDRCHTCHTLIDKAGFEKDDFGILGPASKGKPMPNPYKTHPRRKELLGKHPIDRFGCTPCHMGQGRALTVRTAHAVVTHEKKGLTWSEPLHYWEEPMLNVRDGSVSAGCRKCHDGLFEVPGADALNEGKRLFAELGCHGCHNTGLLDNLPRVGPELAGAAKKLREDWLVRWLRSPKSFRPTTRMPNFRLSDEEAQAIAAYILQGSEDATDRKMAELKKEGAPPPAPPVPMEVPSAPGMTSVPVAYGLPGEAPIFVQVSSPPAPGKEYSGKELIEQRGSLGCHTLFGKGNGFAPELDRVGEKIKDREWLVRWITNPRSYDSKTAMPVLRLPPQEVERIADYLLTLKKQEPDPTYRINRALAEKGRKLVASYGCFGCHLIPGMEKEGKVGIELNAFGRKSVEQLDFGFVTDIPETWEHWTKRKLQNPRAYETNRIALKMPVFEVLTPDNIDKLVIWLRSLRGDNVHPAMVHRLTPSEQLIEKGREIVRYYNCRGCHVMEGKGGDIRKLYSDAEKHMAPPNLAGEGAKEKSDWLIRFLKRPFVLRPWFQIRMPTFQLSDEEGRALAAYFAALDRSTYPFEYVPEPRLPESHFAAGKQIFESLKCVQCHPAGVAVGAKAGELAPNLGMAHERLREDWIVRFVSDPQKIQAGVNMPQFWSYDESSKKFISPLPSILGGDSMAQMRAVRDYIVYRLPKGL